ncbi:MAG: glyoxalase superfamily protein [Acidimicrobiales bacterium]
MSAVDDRVVEDDRVDSLGNGGVETDDDLEVLDDTDGAGVDEHPVIEDVEVVDVEADDLIVADGEEEVAPEQLVPIIKVAKASVAADWYQRLGFEVTFIQQYSEEFPAYIGLRRGPIQLHLSEHAGDATPDTLLYLMVDDVDAVAGEFGVEPSDGIFGSNVELTDPDGNRVRVGSTGLSALGD